MQSRLTRAPSYWTLARLGQGFSVTIRSDSDCESCVVCRRWNRWGGIAVSFDSLPEARDERPGLIYEARAEKRKADKLARQKAAQEAAKSF